MFLRKHEGFPHFVYLAKQPTVRLCAGTIIFYIGYDPEKLSKAFHNIITRFYSQRSCFFEDKAGGLSSFGDIDQFCNFIIHHPSMYPDPYTEERRKSLKP